MLNNSDGLPSSQRTCFRARFVCDKQAGFLLDRWYLLRAILCDCIPNTVQVTHIHTSTTHTCACAQCSYHSNFLKQLLFPYLTNKKTLKLREAKKLTQGLSARK